MEDQTNTETTELEVGEKENAQDQNNDESRTDDWNGVDIIESMCMSCGENGVTRLLIHKIPYFRELIIASFSCEHCNYQNNEVTFGGAIQPRGSRYELDVLTEKDLNRQVIKSDSASIIIPELEFEIPPGTQKGEINTLEGYLTTAAKNLAIMQGERKKQAPELYTKIAQIILGLSTYASGSKLPFHIILDDPAGNSFIENPLAPLKDPQLNHTYYTRTAEQDISLGLQPADSKYTDETNFTALIEKGFGSGGGAVNIKESDGYISATKTVPTTSTIATTSIPGSGMKSVTDNVTDGVTVASTVSTTTTTEGGVTAANQNPTIGELGRDEVLSMLENCPNCSHPGESLMAVTTIPHFKEVIIMAFTCQFCGFRNSEVKGGGAVPTYGTQVQLRITDPEDLKRDVLKSDSSNVGIPELGLELQHGSLGGLYTTVEGLLVKIYKNLAESNPFATGDSTRLHHSESTEIQETQAKFQTFLDTLKAASEGRTLPLTLTLRDPLGNSFISARLGDFTPPEDDPNLTIEDFVRSFEENEDIGLNDLNTAPFETGVVHDDHLVLSDRRTHIVPKGPDHPTPFAKGVPDETPGGIYFGPSNRHSPPERAVEEPVTGDSEAGAASFVSGPAGWRALKPEEQFLPDTEEGGSEGGFGDGDAGAVEGSVVSRVPFQDTAGTVGGVAGVTVTTGYDDDQDLDFLPTEGFEGARAGMVFRRGTQGLGYYEDRLKKIAETSSS